MSTTTGSERTDPSWVVVAAGVSAALHVGKLPPALPALQHEFGASLVEAGFLLSTVQVAGMLLGLVVGLCADRWGLRRSLLAGLLLMAAASLLAPLVTRLPCLLGLRALEGFGLLLAATPAPGLIRRHVPASALSARLGWWGAYMPMGSALGLLLGPWVLQAASWRWWWGALGGVSLAAAAWVWRRVPADPVAGAAEASTATPSSRWRTRLALTVRSPGPWLVALAFMVYSAQWLGVVGFLPTLYAQTGVEPRLAGVLTAFVAAANIVGNVAAGRLLQRGWTARRCLRTGFAVMGACTVLAYAQLHGQPLALPWRFAAVVLFSAAGGLVPGSLFASVLHAAPSRDTISTTVGFMQQWSSAGQFAGPPLLAALAMRLGGWQWSWVLSVVLCAAGWALAAGVQRQWKA